jgi:hypothetical protein
MAIRAARLLAVLGLIFLVASVAACKKKTPVAPDPVLSTDVFTGTISPLGVSFHTFTVNYTYAFSGASVTVTNLTTVANSTPQSITIGVAFGAINFGVCNQVITNSAVALNTEITTSSDTFGAGTYCVQVFDNTAAPTVTEPLNYSITVKHY